jgi:hypothetical protein
MERLTSSFNPCVVEGLMCRTLMSVAWDGYLYDCDFNLAIRLPLAGRKTHISEMEPPPSLGQESLCRTTATRVQPGQASHEPGLFRPEFRFSSRTLGFFPLVCIGDISTFKL